MPSIKCPSCGHRMLRPNATQTCTNCGAPLLPPELMDEEQQQQSLVVYGSSQVASARPAQASEEQQRALQPYPTSSQQVVSAHQQALDVNPFDASAASVPQVFTGSAEVSMPVAPQPWESESLPRGFPKRPPDISGTLVLVQSQHEIRRNNGFSKALVDALWPAPEGTSTNKERQVNVTTLRIRNSSDGVQQDARMEGYLKGANISIGDTISLWGRRYKGSLVVYRGYNHTTKSVVMTSTMTSPLPILLFLLLLVALFFLLSSFLHISLLPNLQQLLH